MVSCVDYFLYIFHIKCLDFRLSVTTKNTQMGAPSTPAPPPLSLLVLWHVHSETVQTKCISPQEYGDFSFYSHLYCHSKDMLRGVFMNDLCPLHAFAQILSDLQCM